MRLRAIFRGRRGLGASEEMFLHNPTAVTEPTTEAFEAWLTALASGFPTPGDPIATTTYTVTDADAGKMRPCTNPAGCVITVPIGLTLLGASFLTFAPDATPFLGNISIVEGDEAVNVYPQYSCELVTMGRMCIVTLLRFGTDTFIAMGGLDSLPQ